MKKLDDLQLYYGQDYKINDHICIHQPRIGEILEYGEAEYFGLVKTLTAIPSDMKSVLFDRDIDYEEIEDFDLFCMIARGFSQEQTAIIFGDLDFKKFQKVLVDGETRPILYNPEGDIIIDLRIYLLIVEYLRKVHGFKVKIEKAGNERT